MTAKFEAILDLEAEVRVATALVAFLPINTPDHVAIAKAQALTDKRNALFGAVTALSPAEATAYGVYRLQNA